MWRQFVRLRRAVATRQRCISGTGRLLSSTTADYQAQAPPPLVLVLDLDETLVRVACDGVHKRRCLEQVDFSATVELGEPPVSFNCRVRRRPGLSSFFEWIQDRRNAGLIEGPWLYTTSSKAYTKALLKQLDPRGHIFSLRVLAQKACMPSSMPGFFLKDLARVPCQGSVQRKVLVDNNPVSFVLNPQNAVLVRDWLGQNDEDVELARVQAVIDTLIDQMHGPEAGSAEEPGDYARHLAESIPGSASFHQRLEALRARLDAGAPPDVPLRAALRAVTAECDSLKKELLGAAP